ncbi:hypothetical protein LguiB_000869 [Lonicera macranthoides]
MGNISGTRGFPFFARVCLAGSCETVPCIVKKKKDSSHYQARMPVTRSSPLRKILRPRRSVRSKNTVNGPVDRTARSEKMKAVRASNKKVDHRSGPTPFAYRAKKRKESGDIAPIPIPRWKYIKRTLQMQR